MEERQSAVGNRPVRVQLRRTKGWQMPANTVKVDRTTPWGNPYVVGQTSLLGVKFHGGPLTAEQAVAHFRGYMELRLGDFPGTLDELRGKNLACWCPPGTPCHADVLLELANGGLRPPGSSPGAAPNPPCATTEKPDG